MSRWRAILRLAARDARRSRSRLVALMVLVPVLLATIGAVVERSAQLDPQDVARERLGTGAVQAHVFGGFGGAEVSQDVTGRNYRGGVVTRLPTAEVERRLREVVSPRNRLVPQNYGSMRVVVVGKRVVRADVGELDVTALGVGAPVSVVTGRAPTADGEVLVKASAGGRTVIPVGTRFSFLDEPRVLTVVGSYRVTDPLWLADIVGRPGALIDPRTLETGEHHGGFSRGWLVIGPDPVTWAQVQQVNAFGGLVLSRAAVAEDPPIDPEVSLESDRDPEEIVIMGVALALVLLQIALMVGTAIAVGTRRDERLLAMVSGSGGTPAQLAWVVLSGAGAIGLLGSVIGAALGAGAGAAVVRAYAAYQGEAAPRVEVVAADLAWLVIIGTIAALFAGVLPALRVARLDVVAALTGRRTESAPRMRVPVLGLGLFAAGAGLAWWAGGQGLQAVVVAGIAVGEVGVLLATSAIVAVFARLARWAPVSARFALRDAARQRSRTVPALAATVAAVAAAVAVLVLGASVADLEQRSSRQQAALGTGYVTPVALDPLDLAADQPGRIAAALRESLGVQDVVYGYGAEPTTGAGQYRDVSVRLGEVCLPNSGCSQTSFPVVFVDPAAAAIIAPEADRVRAALDAGTAVVFDGGLLDRDGRLPVTAYGGGAEDVTTKVPALLINGPQRLDFVLAPRAMAGRFGLELAPWTAFVRPTVAPTPLQLARLDVALARIQPDLGYSVETGPGRPVDHSMLLVYAALAVLVALAGTFIAVGLAAADARPDFGTLAAVGADPSVRRWIGAWQAGAIAVPGVAVGGAAGIVAGAVLVRLNGVIRGDQLVSVHLVVPAGQTVVLVLVVPLLAVALGWLTARSRLDVVRRLGE